MANQTKEFVWRDLLDLRDPRYFHASSLRYFREGNQSLWEDLEEEDRKWFWQRKWFLDSQHKANRAFLRVEAYYQSIISSDPDITDQIRAQKREKAIQALKPFARPNWWEQLKRWWSGAPEENRPVVVETLWRFVSSPIKKVKEVRDQYRASAKRYSQKLEEGDRQNPTSYSIRIAFS